MSKKIKFFSKDIFVNTSIAPYVPSKRYIPDWYKDSKAWINGDKFKLDHNRIPEKDIKLCIPFLDSLSSGYTLELWCDIYVKQEDNGPSITWFDQSFPPISVRNPEVAKLLPTPLGCRGSGDPQLLTPRNLNSSGQCHGHRFSYQDWCNQLDYRCSRR